MQNKSNGLGPARIDLTITDEPGLNLAQIPYPNEHTFGANHRLPPLSISEDEYKHTCYCEPDEVRKDEKDIERETRRKLKEERLKRKERKQRRRAKLEKECLSERMNCFSHDNDHWKTEPMWRDGPFCFCMNANNNTYSCVRTINGTHNFLYCEFVTGLVTFYNLRIGMYYCVQEKYIAICFNVAFIYYLSVKV